MSEPTALPAGVYCRISDDPEGRRVGVDRQERICRELATARGWESIEVYVDNDVSAFSGRVRPAYHRMLQDLQLGRLQAVISWDADRLHRSTRELEDFMDMAIASEVTVVTVTGGEANLASAEGRLQARLKGTISRYESEHKTERTRAAMQSLAQAGRWKGGPRPYGYQVDRDNHGRPLGDGRLIVVDAEAAIVREAAARVRAGETIYRICKDLNAREIPTAQNRVWRTQTLRRVLTNPTTAGMREYKGEIVAQGLWPALLSPSEWDRLRALLLPQAPGKTFTGQRIYLLTGGIAVCGTCGANLHAHSRRSGVRSYNCMSGPDKEGCGGVTCSARALDNHVAQEVLARAALQTDRSPTGTVGHVNDATVDVTDEFARLYVDGRLSTAARRVVELGLPLQHDSSTRARLPELAAAILSAWERLPLGDRREKIARLLEHVVVHPVARRGGGFQPERVELVWRPTMGTERTTPPQR